MRYLVIILLSIPLIALVTSANHNSKTRLSEYTFFNDLLAQRESEHFFQYDLNTPLFTDYAWKSRYIFLPEGSSMKYRDTVSFEFPEGTVIVKNFFYPEDFRKPADKRRMIETRLLIKEDDAWKAMPYVWNETGSDALLSIAGAMKEVSWKHYNGKKRKLDYLVPNINQCKGCHSVDGRIEPIGPKVRHLNRGGIGSLKGYNQIDILFQRGKLVNVPKGELPRNANWADPESGTLEQRARAWLDINCAHCHDNSGTARNTGLFLSIYEKDQRKLGVMKTPVAAGRASERLQFDIVPGHPNKSILLQRMITNNPGERMPEIGRTQMDEEGVKLIRAWIESLED